MIRTVRFRGFQTGAVLAAWVLLACVGLSDAADPPIPVLDRIPRSDWLNVADFGARGDGEADDTVAIQAALTQVDNGGTVYLPAGTYRITETLLLTRAPARMRAVALLGHGRNTRLVWHGEAGGAIFHPDGVTNGRYDGIVFDGRGVGGVGLLNKNHTFETQSEHRNLAFLNFTEAGFLVHRERRQAVAEPIIDNCYFANNRVGISFTRHNDYNFTLSHCEFRDNDIGIVCHNGQFLLRNSHFSGSREIDIVANPHHASSIRRCTSNGSRAFLRFTAPAGPMTIQDVNIAGWSDPEGAIQLGGAPVTLFDASFSNGPDNVAPIRIRRDGQRLVASGIQLEGGGEVYQRREWARINEVPAGERGPVVKAATQRFIQASLSLPGKVFDARVDFGAKGDNRTDDTAAIQATLDAAREHGRGALAYLPNGGYRVTDTLNVSGENYYISGGGSGFTTRLRWDGAADGVMLHIHNPRNITLKHISIGHHDAGRRQNNAIDVLHTSDGSGSAMVYDGVWAYGLYQKQPHSKGFVFRDLREGDVVHIRHAQGNLRFQDCAGATLLANVAHEGSLTVEGRRRSDQGLLGVIVRLSTVVTHAAYLRDNASLIASDFYNEQSDGMFHLSGSPDLPPGRITWTGGRSHMGKAATEPSMVVDGYRGELFLGGKDFSDYRWASPSRLIRQTGDAAFTLHVFGNVFYGCNLVSDGGDALRVVRVGNGVYRHPEWENVIEPEDVYTEDDLAALARAFDDLRLLGEWDLKLNSR